MPRRGRSPALRRPSFLLGVSQPALLLVHWYRSVARAEVKGFFRNLFLARMVCWCQDHVGGSDDGARTKRGRAEATGRTAEEASRRGLLSRDKGRKGFAVGARASDNLQAPGKISPDKAAAVAGGASRTHRPARNLTPDQASYLRGLEYEARSKSGPIPNRGPAGEDNRGTHRHN